MSGRVIACSRCGCDLAGKEWCPVPVPRPTGMAEWEWRRVLRRRSGFSKFAGPPAVIVCSSCYVVYESNGRERPELEALAHSSDPAPLVLGVDIVPVSDDD